MQDVRKKMLAVLKRLNGLTARREEVRLTSVRMPAAPGDDDDRGACVRAAQLSLQPSTSRSEILKTVKDEAHEMSLKGSFLIQPPAAATCDRFTMLLAMMVCR